MRSTIGFAMARQMIKAASLEKVFEFMERLERECLKK